MSTQGGPGLDQSQYKSFRCSSGSYQRFPHAIHLDAQDELINKTHQKAQPRLWFSMMSLVVVVAVVASWSKSCQKFEELSKSPKTLKGLKKVIKAIGSEDHLPKHRSSISL